MTDTTTDKGLVEEIGSGWTAYHETTDRMQALYEKHGCSPGSNRFDWLDEQLSRLSRITAPVEGMGLETTEIERSEWFENLDLSPVVGIDNSDSRRLLRDLESLSARLRVAEEALEPFARFGRHVDENGWTSNIHREAISYWFGPSEFRRAASIRARRES